MKIYAYLVACLGLPFVLLAEDEEAEKANPASDENAEAVEAITDSRFERFKTILDRMPFGRPPPGFNPDAPGGAGDGRHDSADGAEAAAAAEASEVEQQIISSVKVSMLNRTGDGRIFVGFTDSSVQPAKNYLLELGEKREKCEWEVVGADPDNRQVTLSKGGVEATLKLGGGGGASGDKDKDGKAKNAEGGGKPGTPPPGIARGRLQMTSPGADAEDGGDRKLSGLEIARARRQRNLEMQQAEMEQRRQAAELAQKEREQEKRDREMAAAERKEQRALLMQLGEEIQRQREEREQRQAETEGATPQGGAQVPVTE